VGSKTEKAQTSVCPARNRRVKPKVGNFSPRSERQENFHNLTQLTDSAQRSSLSPSCGRGMLQKKFGRANWRLGNAPL
jgi:hypothetical protein